MVKRKGPEWLSSLAEINEICTNSSGIDENDEIQSLIDLKTKRLDAHLERCRKKNLTHTA